MRTGSRRDVRPFLIGVFVCGKLLAPLIQHLKIEEGINGTQTNLIGRLRSLSLIESGQASVHKRN